MMLLKQIMHLISQNAPGRIGADLEEFYIYFFFNDLELFYVLFHWEYILTRIE